MNDHLKQFATHSAYEAVKNNLDKPNVVLCTQENEVHFNTIKEITFTIEEKHWNQATQWYDSIRTVQYSALEGMSWSEWLNSEYNTNNFVLRVGQIQYEDSYTDFGDWFKVRNNNSDVQSTDIIVENNTYTSSYVGSDPD